MVPCYLLKRFWLYGPYRMLTVACNAPFECRFLGKMFPPRRAVSAHCAQTSTLFIEYTAIGAIYTESFPLP